MATALVDSACAMFGIALVVALVLGLMAARTRDSIAHRAWMNRAYAICMGITTNAWVMFPIYLTTGAPIQGLEGDQVFVGWWMVTIGVGKAVVMLIQKGEKYP